MDEMFKINLFILIFFTSITFLAATLNAKEPILDNGAHTLIMDKAIFKHTVPMKARIIGDDCGNLSGYVVPLGKDKIRYKGKFYCFPYVNNIHEYLSKGKVEYIDHTNNEISFKNGPILFPMEARSPLLALSNKDYKDIFNMDINDINDELFRRYQNSLTHSIVSEHPQNMYRRKNILTYSDISGDLKFVTQSAGTTGAFVKINAIKDCSNNIYNTAKSFCVLLDYYDIIVPKWNVEYIIFCWDCIPLKKNVTSIQRSILFSINPNYLALNGGIAVNNSEVKFFNTSNRYDSWRSKFELASPYNSGGSCQIKT